LPKEEINLILNAKIPTLQTTMRHNYSDQLSQIISSHIHPTLVLQRSLPQLHRTTNAVINSKENLKSPNSIPTPRSAMSLESTQETRKINGHKKNSSSRNEIPPRANNTLTAPAHIAPGISITNDHSTKRSDIISALPR